MKYLLLFLFSIPTFLTAQVVQGNLLGTWSDNTLVPSRAHNNTYNEVWGLALNGREYAVIGSTKGTHIIDVTNPSKPVELFVIEGGTKGTSIIHRDYHHFDCYLYVVADEGAQSTLQIIDISSLPEKIDVVYDNQDIVRTSHNIYIDSSKAKLYFLSVSGTNGRSAMQIFDLKEDPLDPKFLGEYSKFGDIQASHVHDAFVQNDTAYLNCGNQGFAIVDFSDTKNPVTLATMRPDEYPNSGYNHAGWLSSNGEHYYLADETHGSPIKVVELEHFDNIHVSTQITADSKDPNSIAHNPVVACDYLYVSYYYDGLQVYDISNPAKPERVMFYPTSTLDNDKRYKGSWGVYPLLPSGNILVSDMQNGLFVLEALDYNSDCKGITTCSKLSTSNLNIDINNTTFNYSNGQIHFILEGTKDLSFYLYNTQGQLIQENLIPLHSGPSYSIDLKSSLVPGLYLIELKIGSRLINGRLYIQ